MKKEKMNNKGFSLVELIIVIAIMAVLVVVLAPQYLKYVERSRNSTDTSNATSIVTALQVWAADPNAGDNNEAGVATTAFKKADTCTITISSTGGEISAGNENGKKAADSALKEAAITIGDVKCKSKTNWTSYIITATVEANGSLKIEYSSLPAPVAGADDAFKTAMTK